MTLVATKSQKLKSLLANKIHSGEFKSGQRIYSERQLACKYGIARATANKILEELEREGLIERKQGIGTFVKDISQKTYNIVYLYDKNTSLDYPWLMKLLGGMERYREEWSFRLNVCGLSTPVGSNNKEFDHILNDIRSGFIDGIVVNVLLDDIAAVELEHSNVPIVFVENRHRHLGLKYPLVGVNLFEVGYQAVKHLYEQGYRKIMAIHGFHGEDTRKMFLSGFKSAMEELGLRETDKIYYCKWSAEESRQLMLNCYSKDNPDAVVCSDDMQAAGVLRACDELGLTSKDLGVIGAGNLIAVCEGFSLTTFETHIERVGELAMKKLIDLIEHRPIEKLNEYIEPKLIVRTSTCME